MNSNFSKAFDRINYDLLIEKLRTVGMGEKMLNSRMQFIKVNHLIFNERKFSLDVPGFILWAIVVLEFCGI